MIRVQVLFLLAVPAFAAQTAPVSSGAIAPVAASASGSEASTPVMVHKRTGAYRPSTHAQSATPTVLWSQNRCT